MFLYELCEILHPPSFVLEDLVIFRQAWAFQAFKFLFPQI